LYSTCAVKLLLILVAGLHNRHVSDVFGVLYAVGQSFCRRFVILPCQLDLVSGESGWLNLLEVCLRFHNVVLCADFLLTVASSSLPIISLEDMLALLLLPVGKCGRTRRAR
jgi:hypothetical protein